MLNDLDKAIFTLQTSHPRHSGIKEGLIRDLDITPTHFYQRLTTLTRDPDALTAYPVTLHTYQQMKDTAYGHHHPLSDESR